MENMQQEKFEEKVKGIPEDAVKDCKHEHIVKLYFNGTHSDYGCLDCGMEHSRLRAFKRCIDEKINRGII